MKLKNIYYMLYPVHIFRNFLQYAVGAAIFYTIFGEISFIQVLIGGIAFVLFYQFIYTLNDLVDYKYDIKSKLAMKNKQTYNHPLHSKLANKKPLLIFSIIISAIGLYLTTFISTTFFYTHILLLLFNFVHSNPLFRIKSFPLLLYSNMTIIQFLKFSLGWFSQVSNLIYFPYWFFLLASISYIIVYRHYKTHFEWRLNITNSLDFLIIFTCIISFTLSLILYSIPFLLLFVLILGLLLFRCLWEVTDMREKMRKSLSYALLIYVVIIFLLILLRIDPFISNINNQLVYLINLIL